MTRPQSHAYPSAALVRGWVTSHNDPRTGMLRARIAQNVCQIDFLMINKVTNLQASKPGLLTPEE